jgi:Putative Flp pilus-assembly TadE/G-like
VLAITALMMLALMGFVALAVDVGSWYTTQTRMQTAVDAAALAAAIELADPGYAESDVVAAAEDGATWNGFDPDDGATVAVTIAPDGESVEVVITETSAAAFAGLFLEDPVSIQARAVGGLKAGAPICLLALDPGASNALYLDSNAELNAPDCAVHVNSASSSALTTVELRHDRRGDLRHWRPPRYHHRYRLA